MCHLQWLTGGEHTLVENKYMAVQRGMVPTRHEEDESKADTEKDGIETGEMW